MGVTILCVGKLRERFFAEAAAEYEKRLSRLMPVTVVEVPDESEPAGASPALCQQVLRKEGERLLARLAPTAHGIGLCVEAKQPDSPELAAKLRELFLRGKSDITFVIGGSLGLHQEVLKRLDERMSMSRLTFPHQLARVLLLEQLYRAAKINAGERYHK
ncbi:MAG: 23S rRNA (pseudouridine(1915)-N(3))-methyltransferase RlmH [Candidatus Limiplasma sp.]|nr:23S rRNA (pseudouridine(1915)-N(3))-methyltransferase RlmH [Candidatus Limiplasma sp.]